MALTNIKGPRTSSDIRVDELQLEISVLTQELADTQAELTATRELTGLASFGEYGIDDNWGMANASVTSTNYGADDNWTPNPEVLHNSAYGVDDNWGQQETIA